MLVVCVFRNNSSFSIFMADIWFCKPEHSCVSLIKIACLGSLVVLIYGVLLRILRCIISSKLLILRKMSVEMKKGTAETLTAGVPLESLAGLLPHSLAVIVQPKEAGLPP